MPTKCTGIRAGIEAAIHATSEAWNKDSTEALLQVDAANAFNRLNRKVALHNIQEVCPPMKIFLQNIYQKPAKLSVSTRSEPEILLSEERCTQGDPAAMAFYALGAKPLIDELAKCIKNETCQQSWYADDSNAIGKFIAIKDWWEKLVSIGPKFGYFPEPSKTILIVKNPHLLDQAKELFSDTGIEVTLLGQRHLGAVIGSDNCRDLYVSSKIKKWIDDIMELSNIAIEEPQIALSAFTKSICHRWSFLQRTIPNIQHLFKPLEDCIKTHFLPSIVGRKISDIERKVLSLPVRFGGLGVANPVETACREYYASKAVTQGLADLILHQEQDLSLYSSERTLEIVKEVKHCKESFLKEKYADILTYIENSPIKRCLELNREKGAGSWLPKIWLEHPPHHTPHFCGCGKKNSVDHTLICMKGGYVHMRHNALRDLNAELQREVCRGVVVEPQLLPLENEIHMDINGTNAARAATDISSRGIWSTFEHTFFDVRVLHPNAPSYKDTSPAALYNNHEKEKMSKYASRILAVDKGSFTPLIYTTFGGWGPQATAYHKKLASLIAKKRNEDYHHVINHIRTKVRFSLLRSILVAMRGERGKTQKMSQSISSVSFNMVPDAMHYESP